MLDKELEIVNMGDLNLKISNITFNINDDSLFSYNAELPMSIIPWGIETIPVKFKPKSKGVFNAGLIIESNAGNSPYHEVLLEGIGEEPVSVEKISEDCNIQLVHGEGLYLKDCNSLNSFGVFQIYDLTGRIISSGNYFEYFIDFSNVGKLNYTFIIYINDGKEILQKLIIL